MAGRRDRPTSRDIAPAIQNRGGGASQEGSDCLAWLITICRNTHSTSYRRAQRFESVATPELEALTAVDVMERARDAGDAPKPYASAESFGVEEFQRSFLRAVSSARTRRRMMPSSPS